MAPTPLGRLSKSSRLIYRSPENSPEDIAFLQDRIINDETIQTQSTGRLPRPAPRKSAEEFIKSIQESLLGVIICLPPPPDSETESSNEAQTSNQPVKKAKPVPIGHISLFSLTGTGYDHHRNAMIGISLIDGYRGKGYGGEAINWALDWGFQHAALHRIAIGGFSFNENALRLYRKLGFVDEGREREAVYHCRAWHDIVCMSMLEHEWEVLRGIAPAQSDRTPSLPEVSDQ
ncbi:Acyl-CoA N-acyltransferase [Penicillium cf. griseofulvum]|uniref:Acyl-CoA N-acyltransferase n=1 Tax=Penicillium cf. griseofulvum TaxID=2972120 RepID=A0A9W9M4Z4_9EURO|nr:Acyl-CoA N-acyltransferase [Penicillium cf. griseofulvum]KAJ5434843.1 Acyl-CoA N-acyltransferase [Penicillium cf. griseofulvum]KAJ5452674.1 Acyl-CoA N-acyltransferase [Penicillium cf. griseofulvum]